MSISLLIVFCACSGEKNVPNATSTPNVQKTAKTTPEPTVEKTQTPAPTIDKTVEAPEADILDAVFNEDGSVKNNAKNGPEITKVGTPSIVYDESIGRYVASFDGGDQGRNCHYMVPIADYYDKLVNAFSLECYFKLKELPATGYVNVLSNLEKGGFGFEIHANSEDSAYCTALLYIDTQYAVVGDTTEIGKNTYVHAVLTFDGKIFTLYINGEIADTYKLYDGESLVMTTVESAKYLGIGADSTADQLGAAAINGSVAVARLYSKAINPSEVYKLYELAKGGSSSGN